MPGKPAEQEVVKIQHGPEGPSLICGHSFHKTEQRFLRRMKLSAAVSNQLTQGIKVVVKNFTRFEAINYFGADVRAAANCRSVSQRLSRLLDRFDYFSFPNCGLVYDVSARPGEGARTDQGTGPGAKILGTKVLTHDFTDICVDVRAGDVDEFTVSILILENFASRVTEQSSNNLRDLAVLDLAKLPHSRLAGEIKFNYVAPDLHMPRP